MLTTVSSWFSIRPRASTLALSALHALAFLCGLWASGAWAGPFTQNGTQPPLTNAIVPPTNCQVCHWDYDTQNHIEPFDTWSGSMMAQAGRDPLFWAALDVANHDIPGVGDWCLRCHVPSGWLAGRSEPPGGSVDGCGFTGPLDVAGTDFQGVSCHVCHRMTVNEAPPPGQESVYTENGQFWIDDSTDCPNMPIEPCRYGPYNYPEDGVPPPHPWAYSEYHIESTNCGLCHNVTHPAHNLIDEAGNDTGILYPIERTYREWLQSDFADQLSLNFKTCQNCHMPDATADPAYACTDQVNNHTGNLATHVFAGGNAWVPDVLKNEYPSLPYGDALAASRDAALDMLQNQSAVLEITCPDTTQAAATLPISVKVTNLTGHKLPTGYPEARRMWLAIEVRDGNGTLVWETGAYDVATGILTEDAQIKIYEAKPGIWNAATSECEVEDAGGNSHFHFVLNNCYAKDNRIPPLGFTGGADLETQPVGYSYPETSPGSGRLVNYDITQYAVPIPSTVVTPLAVTARLLYQTTSKEYVEFLRDEAVDNGFPDDCIERSWGYPDQSRGEILYDMWTTHGKAAPVTMQELPKSIVVEGGTTGVALAGVAPAADALLQNTPNPLDRAAARTSIPFTLAQAGQVAIDIYDAGGRHLRRLADRAMTAGSHAVAWDGHDRHGQPVAGGVYFYRLEVDGRVDTRRLVVLR